MTQSNFLLLLLSALFWSGCESVKKVKEEDPDSGLIYEYTIHSKSGKKHGPFSKLDSSGILLESAHYTHGQLTGIRELYFQDGTVKVRERYENDTLEGLFEYFHPNGRIELSGYYIEGSMYGIWTKYNPDGQLKEQVQMVKNEENGPFTDYFPNGNKEAEGYYFNGPNENGELKLYDSTGVLTRIMWCEMGRCNTTWNKQ